MALDAVGAGDPAAQSAFRGALPTGLHCCQAGTCHPTCLPGRRSGRGPPSPEAPPTERGPLKEPTGWGSLPPQLAVCWTHAAPPRGQRRNHGRRASVLPPRGQWELLHVLTGRGPRFLPPPLLAPARPVDPTMSGHQGYSEALDWGFGPSWACLHHPIPEGVPKAQRSPPKALPSTPRALVGLGMCSPSVLKPSWESTSLEGPASPSQKRTWMAGSMAPSTGLWRADG